jgi:hypothetical protein
MFVARAAGYWDVHVVSHSPQTLMKYDHRQSPELILGKIRPGPSDIELICHLPLGSLKAQIMEKHSFGDILDPQSA